MNSMFMGPNQAYIDAYIATILPQSVLFYDPFHTASFGTTPTNNQPISTFNERYGRTTWNLSQPTAGSQPLYQVNGGKPYLLFDGVDDVLLTAAIDSSGYFTGNELTVIMGLVSANPTASGNALRYVGGNTATRIFSVGIVSNVANWNSGGTQNTTSTYSNFSIFAGVRSLSTNGKKMFTNGTDEKQYQTVGVFTQNTDSLYFGAFRNSAPYNPFFGGIGELIVFNTALSDYHINIISRYFMSRRGL